MSYLSHGLFPETSFLLLKSLDFVQDTLKPVWIYIKMNVVSLCVFSYLFVSLFLSEKDSRQIKKKGIQLLFSLFNVQVVLHGHTEHLKEGYQLVLSNHYNGFDGFVLYKVFAEALLQKETELFFVAKHNFVGDSGDKNSFFYLLRYLKGYLEQRLHIIPYVRGDKESGAEVKDTIESSVFENNNVCVFPEGKTTIDGKPQCFKKGIFHLAYEKQMNVLPITLVYKRNIGGDMTTDLSLYEWFDNRVDIYIHEQIRESDSPEELLEKTFSVIQEPFL
jgi:1-acyl-sn-glycerol-3-phosphate acyltransferase